MTRALTVILLTGLGLAAMNGSMREAWAQAPVYIGSWPTAGLPLGLAMDATGRLYIPDENFNVALRVFSPSGVPLGVFSAGDGFEGYGVLVSADQTILVSNYYGCQVRRYAQDGTLLFQWPTGGQRALFLAFDEAGEVFVTDDEGDAVRKFSEQGAMLTQWSVAHPSGVAYVDGLVYVVGMFNGRIDIFTPEGTLRGSFPTGCTWAEQLFYDGLGHLFLTDHGLHQLKCFSVNGTLLWTLGPSVAGDSLSTTDFFSVVVAPDGTVFAGDYANRRVLVLSPLPTASHRMTFGGLKSRYR